MTLNENINYGDLKNYLHNIFDIDKYKSKMGEDADILVLGFKVKEKIPATDLVEFFERVYDFVLDADISSGEEFDGFYHVFVELERTPKIIDQLISIKKGLGLLTDNTEFKFKYHNNKNELDFNSYNLKQYVPQTNKEYEQYFLNLKNKEIKEFFNLGAVTPSLNEHNELILEKQYAETITAKLVAIGNYDNIKNMIPGALNLSESAQSQVLFLNKFLGNYSIDKIGDKFLICNQDKAIIIEKRKW
jgi:hypothetical protein